MQEKEHEYLHLLSLASYESHLPSTQVMRPHSNLGRWHFCASCSSLLLSPEKALYQSQEAVPTRGCFE